MAPEALPRSINAIFPVSTCDPTIGKLPKLAMDVQFEFGIAAPQKVV
tara:strand:+ start:192 stop:332 length:141 start_codon:yes stop_codon:yes gene_type:complete